VTDGRKRAGYPEPSVMTWERMIYIFKTHPFNMTFKEIREMTFRQVVILLKEYQDNSEDKLKAVTALVKKSKDIIPVFDITRGVYG